MITCHIMREKLFSKIVSTRFSSQSLAGYLAETRQDIGEMTTGSCIGRDRSQLGFPWNVFCLPLRHAFLLFVKHSSLDVA